MGPTQGYIMVNGTIDFIHRRRGMSSPSVIGKMIWKVFVLSHRVVGFLSKLGIPTAKLI
jgi:hypothetical protein